MSRVKPAEVRYYIDADLLGLAKILAALRPDLTFPGDRGAVLQKRERPRCPIASPQVKDPVWIPEVTRLGWLILTRDRHVKDHRQEIRAVLEHQARMIVLAGVEARTTWDQLEIVMCQWRGIERCRDEAGPFMYVATRTTLKRLELTNVGSG